MKLETKKGSKELSASRDLARQGISEPCLVEAVF